MNLSSYRCLLTVCALGLLPLPGYSATRSLSDFTPETLTELCNAEAGFTEDRHPFQAPALTTSPVSTEDSFIWPMVLALASIVGVIGFILALFAWHPN